MSWLKTLFIRIELFDIAIIRAPAHPFWFGRQIPFVGIEIGNQAGFDLGLTNVSTIVGISKLRGVSDLPAPSLTAAEAVGS